MPLTSFDLLTGQSAFLLEGTLMANQTGQIPPMFVGDVKTITLQTMWVTGPTRGEVHEMDSATGMVYDSDRQVSGTATSGGSTTTLICTALEQDDAFWVGIPLRVTIGSSEYLTIVTAWDKSTSTLTVAGLPEEVTSGSTFTLLGTPVLPTDSLTVSEDKASVSMSLGADTVSATPGNRRVVVQATFSDGDVATFLGYLVVNDPL